MWRLLGFAKKKSVHQNEMRRCAVRTAVPENPLLAPFGIFWHLLAPITAFSTRFKVVATSQNLKQLFNINWSLT